MPLNMSELSLNIQIIIGGVFLYRPLPRDKKLDRLAPVDKRPPPPPNKIRGQKQWWGRIGE